MGIESIVQPIIRVAKVCALGRDRVSAGPNEWQYFVLLDGGHRVDVSEETALRVGVALDAANKSDENFFARGG